MIKVKKITYLVELNKALQNLFCTINKNYTFVDKLPIPVKNTKEGTKQFVKLELVETKDLKQKLVVEYCLVLVKEDKDFFEKHGKYPAQGILCCNDLNAIYCEIKERKDGLKDGECD